MKGKPEFRVDVSTDFCIIGDDNEPYWVREDGALEPVECPDMKRRLLNAAPAYGYNVDIEDVLKDTSWAKRGRELTVGDLSREVEDEPAKAVEKTPAPSGAGGVDLSKTSVFVKGRELTVGGLLGQKQLPPGKNPEEER